MPGTVKEYQGRICLQEMRVQEAAASALDVAMCSVRFGAGVTLGQLWSPQQLQQGQKHADSRGRMGQHEEQQQ